QRVGAAGPAAAAGDGEQMQIMVPQNHDRVLRQRTNETQDLERLRPAVDQIADEPQPVAVGGEAQPLQQGPQLIAASLDVTDGMPAHCRIPGMASRKGGIGASKGCPSASTI